MGDAESSNRKVLVVEDEPDLRELLTFNLQAAGYQVDSAGTGIAALRELDAGQPDVVLLDLMLPDMSGTEICRRIRSGEGKQPIIIMLTAKGEEIDRVVGFELGANDYVVKPFSMRELMLRVSASLGRRLPTATAAEAPGRPQRRMVSMGPLTIDFDAHRVFVEGQQVHVSALSMRFLGYLIEHRGRVRSRDDLLAKVWGYSPGATTRTVDTHVKRLRDKLGVAGVLLETVRGAGYRLTDAYALTSTDETSRG
jgi:two-component system phosphate regulon response regulator PhoB